MKLHRIEVENLNAFYGDHVVDLDAAFEDAPLFLIVGPTGAGKSTLLDAVSLALFGETPRLANRRGREIGDDEDSRHAMSRGTGEARAVVVFSRRHRDGRRQRYRATWYCHRARKDPEGNFQSPRRSLERWDDGDTWTLLVDDDRQKFWGPVFETILEGLTVDDFQRTMLLAQGQFTALLKARADEKAAILERLTSTEAFLDIGSRCNKRRQETAQALERVEDRLAGIRLLGPQEVAAIEADRAGAQAEVDVARAALVMAERALTWLTERVAREGEARTASVARDEAEAQQAAAAPDIARLAEDARCQGARARRDEVARLEAELRRVAADRAALVAEDQALEAVAASVTAAATEAAAALAAAATAQTEAAPALSAARQQHEAARIAMRERDATLKRRQKAREDQARAQEELGRAHAAWQARRQAHDQAERSLRALERARELRVELSGFEVRDRELSRRRALVRGRNEALNEAIEQQGLREAAATRHGRQVEALEPRVATAATAVAEARAALTAALDGASDLATRRKGLADAIESARRREDLAARWRRAATAHDEARATLAAAAATATADGARAEAATVAFEAARARHAERGAHADDLRFAVSLIDERDHLPEDGPCPLCGSEAHPYQGDAELAKKDAALRERCARLAEEVATLRDAEAHCDAALREAARAAATSEARRATHEERVETLAEEVASLEAGLAEGSRDADVLRDAVEALAAQVDGLEAAADGLRDGERAHDEVARALSEAALARRRERDEAARLAEQNARDRDELLTEARQLRADAQALAQKLVHYGVQVGAAEDGPDLTGGLRAAKALVVSYDAAMEACRTSEAALQVSSEAAATARTLVDELDRQADALEAEAEAVTEVAALARAEAARALGGRDPEVVDAALREAVAEARRAVEAGRERLGALVETRSALRGRQEALAEAASRLSAALESEADALSAALHALGLADSDALAGRLLDEAERTRLSALQTAVGEAVATARDRAARALERLDAHLAARPAWPDAVAEETATLAGLIESASGRIQEANRRLGGLERELARQGELEDTHRDALAERDRRRGEANLWLRLHRLIGERDGRAFQEFAQILNLAELVERANAHLLLLLPRYRLVTARDRDGNPRLDFAVRDCFQAGRERPITTLSGGETFLVSLALALGLADMRTVGMPIETLLLDEGFGTLDPRSLDLAIEALERLRAKQFLQIGIISHVDALRERIPARVAVCPMGGGRSELRLEGPAVLAVLDAEAA